MKPFEFELTASWDVIEQYLSAVVDRKCTVRSLRTRWLKKKEPMIAAIGLDPRTGRIEQVLSAHNTIVPSVDEKRTAWELARVHVRKHDPLLAAVLEVALDKISARELATNKLEDARPDPRPGRGDKMLDVGSRTVAYLRLCFEYLMYVDKAQIGILCDALSRASASLQGIMPTRLVLSVNPLDLLLVSESTAGGWGSCHSTDGCYAAGSLAYMGDDVTAVLYAYQRIGTLQSLGQKNESCTYLTGSMLYNLPVKLWRQMAFIDKSLGGAVLSREYPGSKRAYARPAAELVARLLFGEAAAYTNYCAQDYSYTLYYKSSWAYGKDIAVTVLRDDKNESPLIIDVASRYINCVVCDDERHDEDENSYVCPDCRDEGGYVCSDCGDWFSCTPYEIYNGDAYCQSCWDESFAHCAGCGDGLYLNDLYDAYSGGNLYCASCFDAEYTQCTRCENYVRHNDATPVEDDTYCNQCVDHHTFTCDECGGVYLLDNVGEHISTHTLCDDCYAERVEDDDESEDE